MEARRRVMRAVSGRVPKSRSPNVIHHTVGLVNMGGVSTSRVVSRHGTTRYPATPMATTSTESVQAPWHASTRNTASGAVGCSGCGKPVRSQRQLETLAATRNTISTHQRMPDRNKRRGEPAISTQCAWRYAGLDPVQTQALYRTRRHEWRAVRCGRVT